MHGCIWGRRRRGGGAGGGPPPAPGGCGFDSRYRGFWFGPPPPPGGTPGPQGPLGTLGGGIRVASSARGWGPGEVNTPTESEDVWDSSEETPEATELGGPSWEAQAELF